MRSRDLIGMPVAGTAYGEHGGARLRIFADLRWPVGTGIGAVQAALLLRAPKSFDIVDLAVAGRIGGPLSPISIARALSRRGIPPGVFWSPGFVPPAWSACPVVVTVHDLMHLNFYTRFHAAYYNLVLKRLYRTCGAVVCVSQYVRDQFLNLSGMPEDRVFTVYNGVRFSDEHVNADFGIPFPYVFYPGNRRRHKNLDRLLRAYSVSSLPGNGVGVVLTGLPDERLARLASVHGKVSPLIRFVGHVTDAEISALYRGAALTALVSLSEGFGLPILEAMAAGVPVLAANVAAMPEVAGDAALLVDPKSIADIAAGLERVAFDSGLRSRLIASGISRARQFSWDKSAMRLWDIVAYVAG